MRATALGAAALLLLVAVPASAVAEVARAARLENKRGLAHHAAGRFDKARASFEKAIEIDPGYHLARFNAACAAAKAGDVDGARRHAEAYLKARPDDAGRLLRDPDLESLRRDRAWMTALRERLRPAGARVRPIVFERLERGGDLFAIGEDGLDEIPIATDPDVREHGPRFTPDGGRLLLLKSRRPRKAVFYDVSMGGERILHEPDDELWSQPFPAGKAVRLAERVHAFELDRDGRFVLFVDRPRAARTSKDVLRLRRVAVTGGAAETLAELDVNGAQHCIAREASGAILVVEGVPRTDYRRGLDVSLSRIEKGRRIELLAPSHPGWKMRPLSAFTACELADDGREIHLGGARIVLGDTARIEWIQGLQLALGENLERVLAGRGAVVPGTSPGLVVTVLGEQRYVESQPAPPLWKVSLQSAELGGGMADVWWSRTVLKRIAWDGSGGTILTAKRVLLEYGPSVSKQGDALAFTRLESVGRDPWVVVAELDGSDERRVVPGQYPVWGPVPLVAAEAGAPLLGSGGR